MRDRPSLPSIEKARSVQAGIYQNQRSASVPHVEGGSAIVGCGAGVVGRSLTSRSNWGDRLLHLVVGEYCVPGKNPGEHITLRTSE